MYKTFWGPFFKQKLKIKNYCKFEDENHYYVF